MASRSQSRTTTDHDEIRQWAEARGGRPAVVKSTRGKGDDSGIVRIDFPGYSGSGSLEEISWEEFFEKFDREKLALVYQDTTARGQKSNFNKIVTRESVTARAAGKRSAAANPAAAPRVKPAARPLNGPRAAGDVRDLDVGIGRSRYRSYDPRSSCAAAD
jgi:hypothetical protein